MTTDTSPQTEVLVAQEVYDIAGPEATTRDEPSENKDPVDDTAHDDDTKPTEPEKGVLLQQSVTKKIATSKPASGDAKLLTSKSGGPPTPTVKKVINSGTFGVGSAKPAAASKAPGPISVTSPVKLTSAATALSKSTTTAPVLRKSTSISSANPSTNAPPMSSSKSSGAGAPPSRRASVIPPRTTATPAQKPRASLLSAVTSRPPQPGAKEPSPRASVGSPTGSSISLKANTAPTPRPRASISDAVKKNPSRTLTGNTPSPASVGTTRATHSISSIREVREDGKTLEELQKKLKDASESLASKSEEAAALETEISDVKSALDAALVQAEAQNATINELEAAKNTSTADIQRLKEEYVQLQADRSNDLALLQTLQQELQAAKTAALDQTELVRTLRDQVSALETEVSAAKANLEALLTSHESDSSAAAQIDRHALLKAQSDLTAISAETEALRASHSAVLEEMNQQLLKLGERAAVANGLEIEIKDLKAEKEDNVNKLSELEVEILELKESQEKAEEEYFSTLSRLRKLEDELVQAAAATQQALGDAKAKEEEHAQKNEELRELHDRQLRLAKDDFAKVTASLEVLQQQMAAAHAAHERTKADAEVAADEYARELEEAEQAQMNQQIELSEEIKRITTELESQEAKYHGKFEAVKAEHNDLLQEAFERAKNEAGSVHGQDLQTLRAESQATIDQLCSAHQTSIENLKAEHEEVLQSTVNDLEKRLASQALELRATADDLAKAKAGLDASHAESVSLKVQLEDARATYIAASASPDQAAEIERLAQEVAHIRDENVMLNDVLAITKESLSEMSTNHTKELEEAAKSRVEEVTKLRATHEEEIGGLAAQKSEIALKLSDLEGEMATLKAYQPTEPSNPKSNGAMQAVSPQSSASKEELQKLHEAHNMRIHDMRAEFEREMKTMQEKIDSSMAAEQEMKQEVSRKNMEVRYLAQEQEESRDQITRLKEDLETLNEQLKAKDEVSTV